MRNMKLRSNWLNEDFDFEGTDNVDVMHSVLSQISEMTCHKPVNLINLDICSIKRETAMGGKPGFILTKWVPGCAGENVLSPKGSTYLARSDANRFITFETLKKKGMTKTQIREMKEVGYFMIYNDGEKQLIMTASPALMATLCRSLKLPCFENGSNAIRDLMICDAITKNTPRMVLAYKMSPNLNYSKVFGVFTLRSSWMPQSVICTFEEELKKFSSPALQKWHVTHYVTTVDYTFPDFAQDCDGTMVIPGVRIVFSDVGDASYAMKNFLSVGESTTLLPEKENSVTRRHRGNFTVEDMVEEYQASAYQELLRKTNEIRELRAIEIGEPKKSLIQVLRKIGFEFGVGDTRAQKFYNQLPEPAENAVTTAQDIIVQVLKIPGEIAKEETFDISRVESRLGNIISFDWDSLPKCATG